MSKKKLTSAQVSVIEALSKEGAYLIESKLYHWNKVVSGVSGEAICLSVHKPTVEFLKRNGIIELMKGSKNNYTLKPSF